jgi:integrase/recombinase XerD
MAGDNLVETQQKNFEEYLKKKRLSSSTVLAYMADIKQLTEFLKKRQVGQIPAVSTELLEEFKELLVDNNYQAKSICRKLNAIKAFFRYLKEENVIPQNPAESVVHPKYEVSPPRILTKMEYRALRDAARNDLKISAIVELFLQTGLRVGELTRVQLEEIANESITIRTFESHGSRNIPLNQAAKKALERYLRVRPKTKSKNLFVTKYGKPLLVRNLRVSINRYFQVAGIKDATVSSLRHTFIAHQLMRGASVVLIQKLAGHKRLTTTERYLDMVMDKIDSKAKLEEL